MKTTFARAGVTTLAALGLAFAGATAHAQTVIAGFDFENLPTVTTTTAAPTTITADSGKDNGTATITPGGTNAFSAVSGDGATPGYAYTTPGDDTLGTSTPSNNTLRLGVGNATTPNNGSALILSASAAGFSNVTSVSYNTYASSASAFQTQTFGYSTNGGTTFTTLTPISVPLQGTTKAPVAGSDPAGYSTETFNLSGITGLAENPNDKFEIIFSGAPTVTSTAAPNDRIDNVVISGTADANPSPAPEPSQMAGLTFFLLGVTALAFRARKRANTAA